MSDVKSNNYWWGQTLAALFAFFGFLKILELYVVLNCLNNIKRMENQIEDLKRNYETAYRQADV